MTVFKKNMRSHSAGTAFGYLDEFFNRIRSIFKFLPLNNKDVDKGLLEYEFKEAFTALKGRLKDEAKEIMDVHDIIEDNESKIIEAFLATLK